MPYILEIRQIFQLDNCLLIVKSFAHFTLLRGIDVENLMKKWMEPRARCVQSKYLDYQFSSAVVPRPVLFIKNENEND